MDSGKWRAGSLQPVMYPTTEGFASSARTAIIRTPMFQTLYSGLAGSKLAVLRRPMLLFLFHTMGGGGGGLYQFKCFAFRLPFFGLYVVR